MTTVLDAEAIERESTQIEIPEIVLFLQQHLGQQFTAYVAGLKDPKMLRKWLDGTDPRPLARLKLRNAYTAARMVIAAYKEETAEAWFFGSNTRLDGEAPAWVLRHAASPDDLRFVVPAAKAFARASE
jgi:hypothetical protein